MRADSKVGYRLRQEVLCSGRLHKIKIQYGTGTSVIPGVYGNCLEDGICSRIPASGITISGSPQQKKLVNGHSEFLN